jgi:hypothetical protein
LATWVTYQPNQPYCGPVIVPNRVKMSIHGLLEERNFF